MKVGIFLFKTIFIETIFCFNNKKNEIKCYFFSAFISFFLLFSLFLPAFSEASTEKNKKNLTDILESRIDLTFQEAPVSTVITGLSEVLDLNIVMDPSKLMGNITVNMKDSTLKEILDHISFLSNLSWQISNNTLVIAEKSKIAQKGDMVRLNNRNVSEIIEIIKERTSHMENTNLTEDDKTNSIYITAFEKDLHYIKDIIREIDSLPADQVMVDVIFLEARVNKDESGGFSWKWDSLTFNIPENATGPGGFFKFPISRSAMDIETGIASAISSGKAKVLNSTRILVQSGTSANLSSGEETPIITNDLEKGPSTNFKSTGVQLTVEPRVRGDGNIFMKMTPSFSEVTGTVKTQMTEAPIVSNRSVMTEAVLRNGEWFVIGGLMRERVSSSGTGLPVLKDIPLVGGLFKGSTESVSRTQTIIFIRPTLKGDYIPLDNLITSSPPHSLNDFVRDEVQKIFDNDGVSHFIQEEQKIDYFQDRLDNIYKEYLQQQ